MGSLAAPAPQRAHACLCGLQGERFEPGMPAVRGKTVRWPRTAGWRAAGKLACPCLGEEAGRQAQATAFGAECAPAGLRPRLLSAGKWGALSVAEAPWRKIRKSRQIARGRPAGLQKKASAAAASWLDRRWADAGLGLGQRRIGRGSVVC